jgi:hypothetical protein
MRTQAICKALERGLYRYPELPSLPKVGDTVSGAEKSLAGSRCVPLVSLAPQMGK